MIVGLTGGIGSGKSAAMAVFEKLGIGCVDADVVAREVVEPGQPALSAIADHFGEDVLTEDGLLDRATLRHRIFSDPDEKRWLEGLLHPLIRTEMQRQLAAQSSPYSVLVAPLLFENDLDRGCDTSVLIDVPESVQVERVLARDGGSEEQAWAIIRQQMPREEKLKRADHVVSNMGSLAELESQLVALHKRFVAQSAS
ncbi:dephospho-CoA kinase [Saccharospirillum salsuginis]|uniref:Dephospho-CoA kinase n=1 Tax=Saccharospirillum salsuginis TaxID=418750 RepID=A0A918KQI9_9GAMM|nr:dephospho-CoA kinase [Saccharospirillum salsuginis]GGX69410.1 dephospho-CoA kinase [Saccharospirillum salsuginis]